MKKRLTSKFFSLSTLISSVGVIILSFACLFTTISSGITSSENYNDQTSYLVDTEYDFKIFKPINEQVEEFKAESSIERVFPYYSYQSEIEFNGDDETIYALFADDLEDMDISSFNDSRIVRSDDVNESDNYIYIDESLSKKIGADLGDEVSVTLPVGEDIEFVVTRIYKNDYYYQNSSVFFEYSGATKAFIDSNFPQTIQYYGVDIKANNKNDCYNYLKSYVPKGSMLERDDFSSNTEYTEYVETYLSRDYSSQIFVKADLEENIISLNQYILDSSLSSAISSMIFIVAILGIVSLNIIAGSKYNKSYIQNTKNNGSVKTSEFRKMYNIIGVICVLLTGLVVCIGTNILLDKTIVLQGYSVILFQYIFIGLAAGGVLYFILVNSLVQLLNTKKRIVSKNSFKK